MYESESEDSSEVEDTQNEEIASYKNEWSRIVTFSDWPATQIVTPEDLAAAGFYSTKNKDEVKCAYCLKVISNWKSGDKPIDTHRSCEPGCTFIQGIPVGDIPCELPTRYKDEKNRLGTYTDWPVPHIVKPEDLAAAGFCYTQRGNLVNCAFCLAAVYYWEPGDIPLNKHISCNPNCSFVQGKAVGNIPLAPQTSYKCEQNRRLSFTNWSFSNIVTPIKLASAGFYFTQLGDSVRCAFCLIVISDWKLNDNCLDKHKLCNPSCRFVKGLPVGDIPCPPLKQYRNVEVRLKSFPSSVTWIVSPENLAAAGLYYTERGNLCMCAFCSTGIYDWKPESDALLEHLSCNPTCCFLQGKLKGNMADAPHAMLKSEQSRLETFTDWPSADIVSPEDLAAAGFYYTQLKDEVKCTFCGEAICDWKIRENVLEKHRSRNKDCCFILGLPTADIPNDPLIKYKSEKARLDTFTYWPKPHIIKPVDLAAAGFFYTQRGDLVRCVFCSAGAYNWQQGDTAMNKHRSCNPFCSFISGKLVGNVPYPSTTKYRCEKTRLETFTDWPLPHIVAPHDLAAAGFFYTQRGNLVKCCFCLAEIKSWKCGDNAIKEHSSYNANCRFILGFAVGNIPLPPPINYKYEEVRLKSFTNWPISDIVQPQCMAAAGLYYTQQRDSVQCFFCCELISNWEPGDSAIDKHRSNNPHCRFIQGLPAGDFPRSPPTEYKSEEFRLGTYTDWPVPHIVKPEDLAAVGFYYTHRGDLVMCSYCSATVYNWGPRNIPLNEHMSCNPKCCFIVEKLLVKVHQPQQTADCSLQISQTPYALQQYADVLQTIIDRLEEENMSLKNSRQCKMCMNAEINTTIIPCGHLVCQLCSRKLQHCPTCRRYISSFQHMYFS